MSGIDIVFLCILIWGAWKGWQSGLLRQGFALLGFFLGLWVASRLYASLGDAMAPHLGSFRGIAHFLAFVLIWIGVPVGLSVLAELLTQFFKFIQLGVLNSLAGAGLGLLKYAFILSCVLNLLNLTDLVSESSRQHSVLYAPLEAPASIVFRTCKKHVNIHFSQQPLPSAMPEHKGGYIEKNSFFRT